MRKGFTLIELLVVVAIIALLISILMPSLLAARHQSRRLMCGANLHAWGTAFQAYAHSSNGCIPRDYGYTQGLYVSSGDTWHLCAAELFSPYLGGPKQPLVPKAQDPFVTMKLEEMTSGTAGSISPRDRYLALVFAKMGVLQCPSFPNDAELAPPVKILGQTISEQPLDYVTNAFNLEKWSAESAGSGDGQGMSRLERIPNPGRLVYIAEANRTLRFDYFGFHDVYKDKFMWDGLAPHMIDDDRHPVSAASKSVSAQSARNAKDKYVARPASTDVLFFDGHVECPLIARVNRSWFTPYKED